MFFLASCGGADVYASTSAVIPPTPTPIPEVRCGDIAVPDEIIKKEGVFYIPYERSMLTAANPDELNKKFRYYFGCNSNQFTINPKDIGTLPSNAPYPFKVMVNP